MPKISVVMSVYKEPVEWMRQSIDSILNQTYPDFEFIIINDKPDREENAQLLNEYAQKDNRIKIITNEENIGLTKSLNKGLKVAKGKYIARMDADDISMPERFQKQIAFLEANSHIGVLGTAINYFGKKKGFFQYPKHQCDVFLFLNSCFAHPSIMGRSEIIKQFSYDESFVVAQDYDLWERMYANEVLFANLSEPLLQYRVSGDQISTSRLKQQLSYAATIRKRALLYYLQKENINDIKIDSLYYSDIKRINGCKSIPYDILKSLNYLLMLAVTDLSSYRLIQIVLMNQIPLSIDNKLKLIYHKINNHKLIVFR